MMPTSPAQAPARVPCATWRREGQPTAARKVLMPCSRFRPRRTHFARHVDGQSRHAASAVPLDVWTGDDGHPTDLGHLRRDRHRSPALNPHDSLRANDESARGHGMAGMQPPTTARRQRTSLLPRTHHSHATRRRVRRRCC